MNMQATASPQWKNTHNTFWHEDQVVISFYFEEPLAESNKAAMYEKLHQYRLNLNNFLQSHGFQLDYLGVEAPQKGKASIPQSHLSVHSHTKGVHLFGLQTHIKPAFSAPKQAKQIRTGVVCLFQLGKTDTTEAIPAGSVADIVNLINDNLDKLNSGEENGNNIQILAASPHMYCGATQPDRVTQGCPAGPPIPVPIDALCQSSPGLWPIELSAGNTIGTGKGVTVFILDSLPRREEISRAAADAGEKNKLLFDVDKKVMFHYQFDNIVDAIDVSGKSNLSVAKDIYGRHTDFKLPDHGLFIAGIVHSIAPDASIECIRVLNDYCVGDTNVLFGALRYIHNRMSEINPDTNQPGDLYEKPVVINLSLVIPTDEEAELLGVKTKRVGKKNLIRTDLLAIIHSLVGLGAVFAASAGNEGDNPMNPAGQRPGALYPAAFANDKVKGIISVGATTSADKVTTYSNFPGPLGIATYGGEIPKAIPSKPPKHRAAGASITKLKAIDALLGIYSSKTYPSLSKDENGTYPAPNNNGWAYWYGTSFSTPIISAILACSLEKERPDDNKSLLDYLLKEVSGAFRPLKWKNLSSRKLSPQEYVGRMIQVKQSKPVEQSN